MTSIDALSPGTVLDARFEIMRTLSSDAIGITYAGLETETDALVTVREFAPAGLVKRDGAGSLVPALEASGGPFAWGLSSFREVVSQLGDVEHPNLDVHMGRIDANGTSYLVTRFESGITFQAWLDELQTPPTQTELDLIAQPLLDGLAALHDAGLLHLNISPESVLLRYDGVPLLCDVAAGLAIAYHTGGDPLAGLPPGYAAPERFDKSVDRLCPATDIYGLAAILYRAATGRTPDAQTPRDGERHPPAASLVQETYREDFLAALDWALDGDPKQRPQSVTELRQRLAPPTDKAPPAAPTVTADQALPAGTEINDYRIERTLGAGGFGITYLATDTRDGSRVAIKEYFPAALAFRDNGFNVVALSAAAAEPFGWLLERFRHEARSLARFRHPNIVGVRRVFDHHGTAYTVLEYLEGQPLKVWMAGLGRRPSQKEIDAIASTMLDALEAVHRNHMLHRDVSPNNIMIRPDGTPVLFDFGAARQTLSGRSITKAAVLTPGYAPFEQYLTNSEHQGPWTDIYAMAATLYECITGKLPPEAPSRTMEDRYEPAAKLGLDEYRPRFLEAIDWGMRMTAGERPQAIAEWRQRLLAQAEAPRPQAAMPARGRDVAAARSSNRPTRSHGEIKAAVEASGPRPARTPEPGTRDAAVRVAASRARWPLLALAAGGLLLLLSLLAGARWLGLLGLIPLFAAVFWSGGGVLVQALRQGALARPRERDVCAMLRAHIAHMAATHGGILGGMTLLLAASPPESVWGGHQGSADGLDGLAPLVLALSGIGLLTTAPAFLVTRSTLRPTMATCLPALLWALVVLAAGLWMAGGLLAARSVTHLSWLWQVGAGALAAAEIVIGLWGIVGIAAMVWRRNDLLPGGGEPTKPLRDPAEDRER
ncbi:MAG: protein kinase [Hyphomicrobiaceae bacterium]